MSINISRKKLYDAKVIDYSSERDDRAAVSILTESSSWATKNDGSEEFIVLDYGENILVNFIEILPSHNGTDLFPSSFRIEISSDNETYIVLFAENSFTLDDNHFIIHFPLKEFRYIRLFITSHAAITDGRYSEISRILTGVYGLHGLDVTEENEENHRLDNLTDGFSKTSWLLKPLDTPERIEMFADLGSTMLISGIGFGVAKKFDKLFPQNFIVESSADGRLYTSLIEQKKFIAKQGSQYVWDIDQVPARYLKIEFDTVKDSAGRYSLALGSFDIYASPVSLSHSHVFSNSPSYASVFQPGLVRFAKDGEVSRDAAVRASDRRLQDATTFFKGVVQFAEDRAATPNTAVMATDSRLQNASEMSAGIVQLAYEYETKKGIAVQASDPRLKEATEKSSGIVKLCPDGATSELGVVRGSDTRLKTASTQSAGIVKLAENGSDQIGTVVQANDIRLRPATEHARGIVQFSKDGKSEEGKAVESSDKRLKEATTLLKGIVELAEDGEVKAEAVVQSNDRRLKDATTESKGIVELASDGEVKAEAVVQSNDMRLKDATVKSKGIVRLASDGEVANEAVVQSSDKRLKDATISAKGIVQLAENEEVSEGKAVQSNDNRLRNATTTYNGIVELAEDGEEAEGKAVQSHDYRLKNATTKSRGIMQFADNNESAPQKAVQANDNRLRESSTEHKGIVALAKNGESAPLKALQSSDSRIKDASTEAKGIMQFARDGEVEKLKAVQSDDSRLKPATTIAQGIVQIARDGEAAEGCVVHSTDSRLLEGDESQKGIVRFAKNGESAHLKALQSDDERLFNKREPLPHEHDYAPETHDFNSHTGTINITGEKAELFSGIMPPSDESAIIFGKNTSNSDGAAGVIGVASGTEKTTDKPAIYGVVGHSEFVGVRGQSTGRENDPRGAGVLGISRNAPGGMFISEHDFSLVVDGFARDSQSDPTLKMVGDGRALKVKGSTLFQGEIELTNEDKSTNHLNLTEMFELEDNDFISHGDVVVASPNGNGVLQRTHKGYDSAVIGVVAGKSAVFINNSGKQQRLYPIALGGSVMCKVDARNQPIRPGDLLVTSDTPGCAMKGSIDSFGKIGTVFGKALDSLESGTGVIRIYLISQ
jgi:hypothetical protein